MNRLGRHLLILLMLAFGWVYAKQAYAEPVVSPLLMFNELLVDPAGSTHSFDTDNNGTVAGADEFLELYNSDVVSMTLDGFELWDAGRDRWFVFPANSVIAPGGYALVVVGVQAGGALPLLPAGSLAFNAGRSSTVFNDSADNLILYDPITDRYRQLIYNGDSADDPTDPAAGYAGFSPTAQREGSVVDFGNDTDGVARTREPAGGPTIVDHNMIAATNASPGISPPAPTAVALSDASLDTEFAPLIWGKIFLISFATLLSMVTMWVFWRLEMGGTGRLPLK